MVDNMIHFQCTYCHREWISFKKEATHLITKTNNRTFDHYRMICPECKRETTETFERDSKDY